MPRTNPIIINSAQFDPLQIEMNIEFDDGGIIDCRML